MDKETLLYYYFRSAGVPLAVYSDGIVKYSQARHVFVPNPAYPCAAVLAKDEVRSHDMTIEPNGMICGYIRDKQDGTLIVLGPVLDQECTKSKAFQILRNIGAEFDRADELVEFFSVIPHISAGRFYKHLAFLNYLINEEESTQEYHMMEHVYRKLDYKLGHESLPIVHTSSGADVQLLACVEFGKIDSVDLVMKQVIPLNSMMGQTSKDTIRSVRNIIISSVAIIARQAAKGGMDYNAAIDLSDKYLRLLDETDDYETIVAIFFRAVKDYTERVHKIRKLNPDSKLARMVCTYVQGSIFSPISLDDIAVYTGYNASYLCRVFKRDTGMTIVDYITEEKIDKAKELLAYSNESVLDICIALGYSSQSYFTTMFKKKVGMSPVAYRAEHG